jgi:hypothetical protein
MTLYVPLCSSVISLFKKYLNENEGKDATNCVNCFMDVDAYLGIEGGGAAKAVKQKKDTQASYIFK